MGRSGTGTVSQTTKTTRISAFQSQAQEESAYFTHILLRTRIGGTTTTQDFGQDLDTYGHKHIERQSKLQD